MAISRVKVWASQEVLTADDLNNEFNNLLDNAISFVSPWTASMAAGGNNLTGLDEVAFNDADADASATGRLRRTNQHLEWHDATGSWPLQGVIGGGIFGLTISNNSGDATNDIDVAAGQAIDDTEIYVLRLTSALTGKRLDAAWAVGASAGMLDTGAIANDVYHIFLIKRSDTGVTDILASASATSPTMPTNYDFKRRIGSIIRSGAAILAFTQDGDYFRLATSILDVDVTATNTSETNRTLTVPDGVRVYAHFNVYTIMSGSGFFHYFLDVDAESDLAVSVTGAPLSAHGGANTNTGGWQIVRTTTTAIVGSRTNDTGSATLRMATLGWWDLRGKNA